MKKFLSSTNVDIEFDSSFYSKRVLEIEKLRILLSNESNHGLTGLKNLGNSCYINTAIQCLSHTVDFTYFMLSKMYLNEINQNPNSMVVKKGLSKI
jgi:hypothetical protein